MVVGARRWWVAVSVLSLLGHLAVLYWPVVTVVGPVTWSDKVVHVLVFAVPVVLVGRATRRPLWTTLAFAAHAPVSELTQQLLLPGRSGDLWDVVADLAGVLVGAVALVVSRRASR